MKHFLAVPILVALVVQLSAADVPGRDVLVIVGDDQGYTDVGFQGSKDVPMPHRPTHPASLNDAAAAEKIFTHHVRIIFPMAF